MAEGRFSVRILDPAQAELEDIASLYLSLVGASSARKITDKIYDVLKRLGQFPLSGPPMRDPELRSLGYRYAVVEKYVVVYRILGSSVIVYHIFDGRSDYPALFRSEQFG